MVDEAVAAIRAGKPVILPTDTVYGLCTDAYHDGPVRQLAQLKGRSEAVPIALLAADLDLILDAVPELRGRAAVMCRKLVPGPYTLVVPNPASRFRWLTGPNPKAIGIRVPDLPAEARAVVERVGCVAATSANLHGGKDPARVEDIPDELLSSVAAVVDAGPLLGTASTVVDLTGLQPQILREGAVATDEAMATIARAASE